jgi:hypothetical protein
METTQNNKLIAEFMGWTLDDKDLNSYRKLNNNMFKYSLLSNFKYHTDWNWLMEVVKKIEELGNDVLITTNYIQIAFDEGEQFIVMEHFNIKITSVYDACIKFIKWYNENE